MATDLQELPPDAKCPTAELVATQLALHLATICTRSKLVPIVPLYALIWGHSFGVVHMGWFWVVGDPTQGYQKWHI